MVERTVETIKNTLKKAHKANEDVYLALLALNSTLPHDGTSPACKLFIIVKDDVNVKTCNTQKRKTRVIYHKHVRQLPEIPDGSTVRIRTDR